MLFSKVKLSLRALELEMNVSDIITVILAAFSTVTTDDCITSWDLYNVTHSEAVRQTCSIDSPFGAIA